MGYWIFPDDYEIPASPAVVTLTTEQRAWVKTRIQNYLTNENRPVYSVELISLAQQRLLEQYSKLVDEAQLNEICMEILSEWGTPTTGEE